MSPGASVEGTDLPAAVVCDAGPLIHLDELDSVDLLSDFHDVLVPDAVWNEVVRHRPHALEAGGAHLRRVAVTGEAPPALTALSRSLVLGPGETEALHIALQRPGLVLLTDDAAARLAAEALRVRVHGSVAVLIRAVRRGRRTRDQAIGVLETLHERSSLHIRRALIAEVIASLRSLR